MLFTPIALGFEVGDQRRFAQGTLVFRHTVFDCTTIRCGRGRHVLRPHDRGRRESSVLTVSVLELHPVRPTVVNPNIANNIIP